MSDATAPASPAAYVDDDSPLDLPGIARSCCDAFDDCGDLVDRFARDVFMIGEWFVENCELMAQFLALYQDECERYGVRVCMAVGFWIRHFPSQFDAHPPLCALVNRLRAATEKDARVDDATRDELDISSVPSYAWLRNVSVRNPISRPLLLSFHQWSSIDLANALGYIDYRVLSRVTISEIKKYVKLSQLRHTPILERSIAVFNSMSCWVQCMILSKAMPNQRAEIITKFVNVGKHLRKQCNFNTLMAVVGGVTHSSIGRLAKTQALLNTQVKKDLNVLTQLLSMSNNFATYRRALKEARACAARIPIMGIHLKDLIAWCNKNNADQFERTARISRRRLGHLANLLGYFLGVNRIVGTMLPDPNMDLINTLKVSFDISYNENDIYNLSVKREPKTSRSGTTGTSSTPLASTNSADSIPVVVFADWASGVCQTPDPDTVNKHISAMVDAVFKHYDHDRNDYISRSEFEQIAGNFPYNLDSFVTIDADRDGQISKSEMKTYFLELNKQSAEFRSGFRHNFQETTFLTPTICSHCKKMLWGLIRQGLKCRDCALVVHNACRRLAIAECRRAPSRQRTQSAGSDECASSAAVAGSATFAGVNASGCTPPPLSASAKSVGEGHAIAMGTLYEWVVNSSPHHHHYAPNHHRTHHYHPMRTKDHSNERATGASSALGSPKASNFTDAEFDANSIRLTRKSALATDSPASARRIQHHHGTSILSSSFDENQSSPLSGRKTFSGSAGITVTGKSAISLTSPADPTAPAGSSGLSDPPDLSGPTVQSPPSSSMEHPAMARIIVDEGIAYSPGTLAAGCSSTSSSSFAPGLSSLAVESLTGVRSAFRSSFHRLLRSSKKYRSVSETTDNSSDGASPSRCQKLGLPSFDGVQLPSTTSTVAIAHQQWQKQQQQQMEKDRENLRAARQQASLASEEVFGEDEDQSAGEKQHKINCITSNGTNHHQHDHVRHPNHHHASSQCQQQQRENADETSAENRGAEAKLHRKMDELARTNAQLRENFRRNLARLL